MFSPVHGSLRRVQAEFPLIQVVQISRASSHPAYHALMRKSMAAGLHCSAFDPDEPGRAKISERAARLYMAAQIEAGHVCPLTMTNASVAALAASPEAQFEGLPHIFSRNYDCAMKPWFAKPTVTLGMA